MAKIRFCSLEKKMIFYEKTSFFNKNNFFSLNFSQKIKICNFNIRKTHILLYLMNSQSVCILMNKTIQKCLDT